jgi:hypothetical protein
LEAVRPLPAVSLPVASKGGHLATHAPEQALCMPTSALNRYRVRPFELTRIDPRLLFETPTIAEAPLDVFSVAAVAALPLPPHAETVTATSGIATAPPKKAMHLLIVRWLVVVPDMWSS